MDSSRKTGRHDPLPVGTAPRILIAERDPALVSALATAVWFDLMAFIAADLYLGGDASNDRVETVAIS